MLGNPPMPPYSTIDLTDEASQVENYEVSVLFYYIFIFMTTVPVYFT